MRSRGSIVRRLVDPNTSVVFRFDWLLFAAVAATSALGLTMVYSSTKNHAKVSLTPSSLAPSYFLERQMIALLLGMVIAGVVMMVDYRKLLNLWPIAYFSMLPLLLAVKFIGQGRGGTTAWFNIGPFQFQPSELAKLVVIVSLAGYCQRHEGELDAWRLSIALLIAGVPMALVLFQNDLGTMLVIGVCVIAVLVVAGLKPVHLVVLTLLTVTLVGGLAASGKFATYRLDRFTGFLDQNSSKQVAEQTDSEYNLARAKAAIGQGGLRGQGLFEGALTSVEGVPAQRTDFIFTAVGEELGFAGGATLLLLFALMVWRSWRTGATASDSFGGLICMGFVAMFAFQVFENVGMTMGMMPITGIPLPFMSYGGSAMIAYWAAIGLILNIHLRR